MGGVELDPATDESNPVGARRFFTLANDGLHSPWEDRTFVNPPYGEELEQWLDKVVLEAGFGFRVCALLPCGARFSTKYFQRFMSSEKITAILFFSRRIAFDGDHNIYDSALWCFNVERERARKTLSPMGRVLCVS